MEITIQNKYLVCYKHNIEILANNTFLSWNVINISQSPSLPSLHGLFFAREASKRLYLQVEIE